MLTSSEPSLFFNTRWLSLGQRGRNKPEKSAGGPNFGPFSTTTRSTLARGGSIGASKRAQSPWSNPTECSPPRVRVLRRGRRARRARRWGMEVRFSSTANSSSCLWSGGVVGGGVDHRTGFIFRPSLRPR